jgi:ABC-type uncharacterized transport system permease subunit
MSLVIPLLVEIILAATVGTYAAACGLFLAYLSHDRFARAGTLAPRVLLVGTLLHAVHITASSFVFHVCPVEGIHFALSTASMLACAIYLTLRRRYRIDVVGAFVAPLALVFLLASSLVAMSQPDPRYRRAILPIHVAANLLGDALFMLAFAAAVAYLLQERRLKQKNLAGFFRKLPPLDALDKAGHRFLLAGFPLLTTGILTGVYWAHGVEAGTAADVARAVFGYTTWLLFAGVLLLRAGAGWRGRRAAYGTIAGFGFAVLVLIVYLVKSTPAAPPVAVAVAVAVQ